MGETIDEAHVFTFVPLPDGSGLLFDGSKGFARVMTPREVGWYEARGMIVTTESVSQGHLQESDNSLRQWLARKPDDEFARDKEEMIARLLEINVEAMREYVATRPDEPGWRPASGATP